MATYTEILADVANNLPSSYHSSILTSAKLLDLLNHRQRDVCEQYTFWWMKRECTQSTVDSQQRYNLPDGTATDAGGYAVWRYKSGISACLIDYDNNRIALTRVLKNSIEHDPAFNDTADAGTPSAYCEDQDDIWLYPKPDHAYNNNTAFTLTVMYHGYPPNLSATNTSNTLSTRWPKVLEFGTTADAYRIGQDLEMSEYYEGKYLGELAKMIASDVERQFSGIEQGLTPTTGSMVGGGSAMASRVQTIGGYVDGS